MGKERGIVPRSLVSTGNLRLSGILIEGNNFLPCSIISLNLFVIPENNSETLLIIPAFGISISFILLVFLKNSVIPFHKFSYCLSILGNGYFSKISVLIFLKKSDIEDHKSFKEVSILGNVNFSKIFVFKFLKKSETAFIFSTNFVSIGFKIILLKFNFKSSNQVPIPVIFVLKFFNDLESGRFKFFTTSKNLLILLATLAILLSASHAPSPAIAPIPNAVNNALPNMKYGNVLEISFVIKLSFFGNSIFLSPTKAFKIDSNNSLVFSSLLTFSRFSSNFSCEISLLLLRAPEVDLPLNAFTALFTFIPKRTIELF